MTKEKLAELRKRILLHRVINDYGVDYNANVPVSAAELKELLDLAEQAIETWECFQ